MDWLSFRPSTIEECSDCSGHTSHTFKGRKRANSGTVSRPSVYRGYTCAWVLHPSVFFLRQYIPGDDICRFFSLRNQPNSSLLTLVSVLAHNMHTLRPEPLVVGYWRTLSPSTLGSSACKRDNRCPTRLAFDEANHSFLQQHEKWL